MATVHSLRLITELCNSLRALPAAAGLCAALLLAGASPAWALPIEASVGSGPDTALVQIQFGDDQNLLFEVAFTAGEIGSGDEVTGLELLATLADELVDFAFTFQVFPFGVLVDSISYQGNSDTNEPVFPGDFWGYWNRESAAEAWAFAPVGASDRVVFDGSWDGWRYGDGSAPPVPEPGTAVLTALGLALLARHRRTGH